MPTISLAALEEKARKLMQKSLAPSTRSKYLACTNTYLSFCKITNLSPFPISQNTLIMYATHLCPTHSHKNISAHLAAIKYSSAINGFDPDLTTYARLYRVLRGIKRSQGSRLKKNSYPYHPTTFNPLGPKAMGLVNSFP